MQFAGKFFGRKKPAIIPAVPQFPEVPIDLKLLPLQTAVFSAAMEASQAIKEGWTERTGQLGIPFPANWAVCVQELGFFLHVVNRFAFTVGGNVTKDSLQDYLTVILVNGLVDSSYDASNAKPGFDVRALMSRVKQEALDVINDAEMEYAQCPTMLKLPFDIKPGDTTAPTGFLAPADSDVTGCLAKRIAEDTSQADTPKLRELIWGANFQAVDKLQIIRQVEVAINVIRN